MPTTSFNDDWRVSTDRGTEWRSVTLPHDAMIHERRDPNASSAAHGAYFLGGHYTYRKTWTAPASVAGKEVSIRFEGVYRHSRVFVDGVEAGAHRAGYSGFEVRIDSLIQPGAQHEIEVRVDNSQTPNARWYTGSGIYRPVWLEIRDPDHFDRDGITFRTESIGLAAKTMVAISLVNANQRALTVRTTLRKDGEVAAENSATATGSQLELALTVEAPALWSAEDPNLYELEVILTDGEDVLDVHEQRVGIRTLVADGRRGLQVNGTTVLLRGANIHHDSGVLGAATFKDSELRRIRILKENGFNAVRSAHNQAAVALLEACDELGMYVMDELFDEWYDHKTDHDGAEDFDEIWQQEVAAIVEKDRNHPSVIMYSIGNENSEAHTPRGLRVVERLSQSVRRLDPTRPVTIGVNMVGATFAGIAPRSKDEPDNAGSKPPADMTSTGLNLIVNRFGILAKYLPRLKAADRGSKDIFDLVDVAGYNYGNARYARDAKLRPNRVMVGTETMPGDIAKNWALVTSLSPLIGDFVWAGWDYLGEAGGGTWAYGTSKAPYLKPYPQLTSGTGSLDILGNPGAPALLAQSVWGLRDAPAIAVRPLDVPTGPITKTSWRSTDAVPSWSWTGQDGRDAEIEVYSAADEVELFLNGRLIGRKAAGPARGFVARFTARYESGTLQAVAYSGKKETGRSALRSAGAVALRIGTEATHIAADPQALAFVNLELADATGVVDSFVSDAVTVTVDGPGILAGLGSAATSSEESFVDHVHTTYRGRALAVVRSTGETGPITVTATTVDHGSASLTLTATESQPRTAHPTMETRWHTQTQSTPQT